MGLFDAVLGTSLTDYETEQIRNQYMLMNAANAAQNNVAGGIMGSGGGGLGVSGAMYPVGGLSMMQQGKETRDHRKLFCVEPVENGYIIEVSGKKYYVEDKVALGSQITALMTMMEVQDD